MFLGLTIIILNLVLTLNILATVLVGIFLIATLIFSKSFSKGWLFLLGLLLLFPSIKFGTSEVYLFDFLLTILALIGMIKLAITNKKVLRNRLTFPFFLIFLISISYLFFGQFFGLLIKSMVWKVALNILLIWFLLVGFQYFFQTQKRIKLFFSLVVGVATIHSIFGLIMFFTGQQTSIGMGISTGKSQHLIFEQANHQINGFLGIGLEDQLGANPLASLLIISIITILGFVILNKQQEDVLLKKRVGRKKKIRFFDGIYKVKRFQGNFKNRKLFRKRFWMIVLMLIQFATLILTFSYSSLIFLGIGIMVMGILMKQKSLITSAMFYLVFLTVIFPSLYSSIEVVSNENLSQWFGGVETIKNNWILGEGIVSEEQGFTLNSNFKKNSFLLFWSTYGFLGLIIFLKIIWQYFIDIYKKYESTKKGERLWFVIVASCFVSLILEGLTSNVLIFGPSAIIFWLMYGIILNLGKDNISERFKKINFI